jgi:hypothetical protein
MNGTIPYDIVWAGKISNKEEMSMLEVISICINFFMIMIFLLKAEYIKNKISKKILNVIIWLLFALFSLNTVGNIFAKSKFEVLFFTPFTLISTILCLLIVIDRRPHKINTTKGLFEKESN